jgi:NSS family neurotransmitter:Na+ symporter
MAELLEEQRESWGTRGGFILAAIGSAVGLGNLWAFPYKLYSYGGGAFLIPYIVALLLVGIPLMILEFSLGHFTQRAAPDAFKSGHKSFEVVGWWGIILGFVIVTYYTVILAYCFSFLCFSVQGILAGGQLPWAGEGLEGVEKAKSFFNDTYLGKIEAPALGNIRWNIFWPLVVTWLLMYLCIFKGVRLVGRIVWLTVPLPWLMLLILAVRGLTLEGSMQGLAYYLGKSDINNNAAIISLADFGTSFVAGLAVFATLGGMAFVTQQAGNPVAVEKVADAGPSLAFVAFPYALAQLPYSAYFSFVFFVALVTLGIDSAFSITESVLASIVDKTGWRRSIVLPVMSAVGLIFGLVYITRGGLNWIETIDGFVNGTRGIALLGMLECMVLGWMWRIGVLRRHANSRSDWKLGKWWDYMIRLVIPILLGTLFFWQLFDDINNESGFLRTPQGEWIPQNCIGVGVLVLVPVIAVVLSLAKSRRDAEIPTHEERHLGTRARFAGGLALALVLIPAVLYIASLNIATLSLVKNTMFWALPIGGIVAIVLSNYIVEGCNTSTTQASWLARWAGVLATMDVSIFIAAVLFQLTRTVKIKEVVLIHDKLSGVSYVILAVVFLIIVGGLGWCFYRALAVANLSAEIQSPDQIDDEG